MKSESVRGRGPENLLRLDTAAVKEVTKEGRDVSGLGAREGLVVRDVLHVHALQVRSLWRTERNGTKKNKKNNALTAFWVCQSSSVLGPS